MTIYIKFSGDGEETDTETNPLLIISGNGLTLQWNKDISLLPDQEQVRFFLEFTENLGIICAKIIIFRYSGPFGGALSNVLKEHERPYDQRVPSSEPFGMAEVLLDQERRPNGSWSV